jgi:hypothetical protein
MRRTIMIVVAAVACLAVAAPLAQAAPVRPDVPTCLIANGGGGGHYTKTLLCVELAGAAGSGRYATAPGSGPHVLTATVQYQRPGGWITLATATTVGWGDLSATTRPVHAPGQGGLRACVAVAGRELCTR